MFQKDIHARFGRMSNHHSFRSVMLRMFFSVPSSRSTHTWRSSLCHRNQSPCIVIHLFTPPASGPVTCQFSTYRDTCLFFSLKRPTYLQVNWGNWLDTSHLPKFTCRCVVILESCACDLGQVWLTCCRRPDSGVEASSLKPLHVNTWRDRSWPTVGTGNGCALGVVGIF